MRFAEELLRVSVRLSLIFAGEVKVDIGSLVTVEPKEGFKRYFVAVSYHFRAAMRTFFRRHIKARAVLALCVKFGVATLGAPVMRRQRIYFGNTRHRRNERRADGAS